MQANKNCMQPQLLKLRKYTLIDTKPTDWLHLQDVNFQPKNFHDAGTRLWRRHRDPLHGHPPRVWLVAATNHAEPGLGPRNLRICHCHSKSDVGRYRHFCGYGGRPVWRLQSHRGRFTAVRPWLDRHVHDQHPHAVHGHCGRADWHGPGRHHLCGHLRGDWAQHLSRQALLGHGCGRRCGFIRAIFDGAHRRFFN